MTVFLPLRSIMPGPGNNVGVDGGLGSGVSEILPNTIGSDSLGTALAQAKNISLTTAQLESMFTTPIVVLPAVTGKSYAIDYCIFRYTSGGTAFTSGGTISIAYVGGATALNTVAASVINSTSSSDTVVFPGASNVTATNGAGIQITNATGVFATGNGSVNLLFSYTLV